MAGFWSKFFGRPQPRQEYLTLLDYAENYLTVFEIGSHEEKTRHATELFNAANDAARSAGATDFVALVERANVEAIAKAAAFSRSSFEEITKQEGGYWLSAYALTHLMILNNVKSLEDAPKAKKVAENAAHLYAAEYARRELSRRQSRFEDENRDRE